MQHHGNSIPDTTSDLPYVSFDAITVPDTLLPSQHADMYRSSQRSPERRLLLKLMVRALDDIELMARWKMHNPRRYARDYYELEEWLTGRQDYPFSFEFCCDFLGDWNPDLLRPILLKQLNGDTSIHIERPQEVPRNSSPHARAPRIRPPRLRLGETCRRSHYRGNPGTERPRPSLLQAVSQAHGLPEE